MSTNAYGLVPHKLIQKAMDIFHVPEGALDTILRYCNKFYMRFFTKDYVTSWQPLLFLMIRGSNETVIWSVRPEVSLGKKWKVAEVVQKAESRLRLKEIVGHVQHIFPGRTWKGYSHQESVCYWGQCMISSQLQSTYLSGKQLIQPSAPSAESEVPWGISYQIALHHCHPLDLPAHIAVTRLYPDLVLWSNKKRMVIITEPKVPWEGNLSWANERKMEERKKAKYSDLQQECEGGRWGASFSSRIRVLRICWPVPYQAGLNHDTNSSPLVFSPADLS